MTRILLYLASCFYLHVFQVWFKCWTTTSSSDKLAFSFCRWRRLLALIDLSPISPHPQVRLRCAPKTLLQIPSIHRPARLCSPSISSFDRWFYLCCQPSRQVSAAGRPDRTQFGRCYEEKRYLLNPMSEILPRLCTMWLRPLLRPSLLIGWEEKLTYFWY